VQPGRWGCPPAGWHQIEQAVCVSQHAGAACCGGAKIVASAVFIDFGITDAITDKHREYPSNYVIPMAAE